MYTKQFYRYRFPCGGGYKGLSLLPSVPIINLKTGKAKLFSGSPNKKLPGTKVLYVIVSFLQEDSLLFHQINPCVIQLQVITIPQGLASETY